MSARPLSALAADLARARRGGAFSRAEREAAARIVGAVRRGGDRAVLRVVRRFDRAEADAGDLLITVAALRRAARGCPPSIRAALDLAYARIRSFHELQRPRALRRRDRHGELRLLPAPLERVGALVPRGLIA